MDPSALPDLEVLDAAALAGLNPPGCHLVVGTVEQIVDPVVFPASNQSFTFTGTLRDGRWSGLTWAWSGEPDTSAMINFRMESGEIPFIPPLFGGVGSEFGNLFQQSVSAVSEEGTSQYWQDGALISVLDQGVWRSNRLEVRFTEDWRARSWSLTVDKPHELQIGKLTRMEALLIAEEGLPSSEAVSVRARIGPLHLDIQRTLLYSVVQPCDS